MSTESANHDNANNNGDQNINRGPIVSALLTFAVAIYRNASQFGMDEIKQSKHILCDVSKVPYQNRNSSNLRSEKAAHTADICDILNTLDNDNMPLFKSLVSLASPVSTLKTSAILRLPAALQELMPG